MHIWELDGTKYRLTRPTVTGLLFFFTHPLYPLGVVLCLNPGHGRGIIEETAVAFLIWENATLAS